MDGLKRRPWWVALVIGGLSTGVGIVAALGLGAAPFARASEAPVRTTGMVQTLPAGSISLDDRLKAIEEAQRGFTAAIGRVETELQQMRDRLPPRKP